MYSVKYIARVEAD